MPTTTVYNLRYPALSDAPDGPAQIQALADDVEAELIRVDADITALETANVRHGVILQQTVVQSVPANALTAISNLNVLGTDPDGYFDGSVSFDRIKIPAGLGGLYFVGFRYDTNTTGTGAGFAEIIRNSDLGNSVRGGMAIGDLTHGGQVIPLAAGDFFKMQSFVSVAHSTVLAGTQMYAWRLGN